MKHRADRYSQTLLIAEFWHNWDEQCFEQRWGLVRNTTSKERYEALVKQGFQNKGVEMAKKATEWKLDDHIKKRNDLVQFLWEAIEPIPEKPHKKDMQWLAIACNDYLRIAKQKGWIE